MAKIFPVIILCIFIAACSEQKIANKIKLVQTIGLDIVGNNVKSTVLIGNYRKKGETQIQFLDTESTSFFDSMPRLSTKTKDPIEYGQLKMVLFGKKFAMKGIEAALHTLGRDTIISNRLQLGVADLDASELLEVSKNYQESFLLSDMIEQNIKYGNLPQNNLHISLFNFYGEGRDVFLPHFKLDSAEIKIDGLALFRNDKYITKIGIKDTYLLKILIENSKNGSYMVPIKGPNDQPDHFILLKNIGSTAKYAVNSFAPIPSVSIDVKLDARISRFPSWLDVHSEDQTLQLKRTISAYFEDEIQKLLSLCKINKVDPVGLGDFIRSKSKTWNAEAFQKTYPEMETKVTVKLNITKIGNGK